MRRGVKGSFFGMARSRTAGSAAMLRWKRARQAKRAQARKAAQRRSPIPDRKIPAALLEQLPVWKVEMWMRVRENPHLVLSCADRMNRSERTRVWALDVERTLARICEPARTYFLLRCAGLTQRQIAEQLGVSLRTVSAWQRVYFADEVGSDVEVKICID